MANWVIYARDLAYGRFAGSEIEASQNDAYAANVVDGNPSNVWTPTSTSAVTFSFNLGSAKTVKGVALCNHSMSGETLALYTRTSFGGGTATLRGTWTIPDDEDVVVIIASASASSQWWDVDISGSTTSDYVGEISLLDNSYVFELDYPSAPRYPIDLSLSSGSAIQRGSSGVPYQYVLGGVHQRLGLTIDVVDLSVDPPGLGRKVHNWYREGGTNHRVWITDDTFGSSATGVGRGHYCFVPGVEASIAYPGARGFLRLALEYIEHDRQGS